MRRRLIRSIVVAGCFVCTAVQFACASSPDVEKETKPLVLNESRIWCDTSRAAENITVITADDIARFPAHNLSDVLQYIAGVTVDTRSGFLSPATFGLHAGEARQVKVMIDGIEFNNEISGQAPLNVIPLENIKRIDIIKGAGSARWGSALGGVINVITKDTGDTLIPHGTLTGIIAEHKYHDTSMELSGGTHGFGYYAAGSYREAAGIHQYNDVMQRHGFVKASYAFDEDTKVSFAMGYLDSNESEGPPPDPDYVWFKQNYYARYGKVQFDTNLHERVRLHIAAKMNSQTVRSFFDETADPAFYPRSEFHNRMVGIDGEVVTTVRESDTWVIGWDTQYDEVSTDGTIGHTVHQREVAPYVNYTFILDPLALTAGVRYDYASAYGSQISPMVGAVVTVPGIPNTRIRGVISRGFNEPPLMWRYYSSSNFTANPDLKPEHSWMYEVGLESKPCKYVSGKVNLFLADISNAISADYSSGPPYMMRNNDEFRQKGIEMEGRVDICKELYIMAGGTIARVQDRHTRQTIYDGRIARNSLKIGAFFTHACGLSASVLGTHERYCLSGYDRRENKILWDAKVAQKVALYQDIGVEAFVGVHNIFNSTFYHDNYYPHPPRYFEGGVTITF